MNQTAWIGLAEHPNPFWEANLRALQSTQPDLVSILLSHRTRRDIFLRLDSSGFYECRYVYSGKTWAVHGINPINQELAQTATAAQQAFQRGTWLCMLVGAGNCVALPHIVAYLEAHHRGEAKGVIGIEEDPGLLAAGFCVYDLAAVIKSGRVLFALGPSVTHSLRTLWDAHHIETLDPTQVSAQTASSIPDPKRQEVYQDTLESIQRHHEEKREAYFTLLRRAEAYWAKRKSKMERVWTHVNDERASGGMLLGLTRGFAECGLEARALKLDDWLFTRFYRCAYDFFSFLPDLILGANHSSRQIADFADSIPIPRLIWYVDHPKNTVAVPFHPHDRCVLLGENFREEIVRRGGKVLGVLPAACDSARVKPPSLPNWKHDVSYVGSVWDNRALLTSFSAPLRDRIEEIVTRQVAEPLCGLASIMELYPLAEEYRGELLPRLKVAIAKARFMGEDALIEYFLFAEANSRRRIMMMASLKDFESLSIYGPRDWLGLLPDERLKERYLGSIDSATELGELYRASKVNLSINSLQGFGFLNPRTFEVPAAGGYLLSDWVPGIDTYFEQGRELRWFQTQKEMQSEIRWALEHEDERRECISRAQERMRREHTYRNRAELVLEYFHKWGLHRRDLMDA